MAEKQGTYMGQAADYLRKGTEEVTGFGLRAPVVAAMKADKYLDNGLHKVSETAIRLRKMTGYASDKNMTEVLKDSPSSFTSYLLKHASSLANVPTFYKVAFLFIFYFFFYKIFYDIGLFFGLNNVELILYMAWFGILLLLVSFIQPYRSKLY